MYTWCMLEKTLESPLDCKEIQPVHPKKEISPECSLEGLMLKLKLQYFGHLMGRMDSSEKTLMLAGKDWRWEEKGLTEEEMVGWHKWLDEHEFEQAQVLVMNRKPGVLQVMGSQRVGHDWATELNWYFMYIWEIP